MNITKYLAKLFNAKLIDETFYAYFQLRSKPPTAKLTFNGQTIYYPSGYPPTTLNRFFIALNLVKAGLVSLNPFPSVEVGLPNYVPISESEVKKSKDTIGTTTYIFNAIQSDISAVDGEPIFLDDAFRNKWGIAIADLIPALVKFAKLDRFDTFNAPESLTLTWAQVGIHNPAAIEPEDLYRLYKLGLPQEVYLFWLLQEQTGFVKGQISLLETSSLSRITESDCVSSLQKLADKKVLSYELTQVNLAWMRTLTDIPASELNFLQDFLKPEGQVLYQLWTSKQTQINPTTFSSANGTPVASFYSALKKLKEVQAISYSFSTVQLLWLNGYFPDLKINSATGGIIIENDPRYSPNKAIERPPSKMTLMGNSPFYKFYETFSIFSIDGFAMTFNGKLIKDFYLHSDSYLMLSPREGGGGQVAFSAGTRTLKSRYKFIPAPDAVQVRYEGTDTYDYKGAVTLIWEATLFTNGVIEFLPIMYPEGGVKCEFIYTSPNSRTVLADNVEDSLVFYPTKAGNTEYDYVPGSYIP